MKCGLGLAALLVAAPLNAASPMSVATFVVKAKALERKGPMALLSSDLKLLTNQVKGDFTQIRTERLAARAAGKPTAFCPPEGGTKLNNRDIMGAMEAIPATERARTDTRTALRAFLVRRHPCAK